MRTLKYKIIYKNYTFSLVKLTMEFLLLRKMRICDTKKGNWTDMSS